MKSIVFAALIAYTTASQQFGNVAAESETLASADSEAVITDAVDAVPEVVVAAPEVVEEVVVAAPGVVEEVVVAALEVVEEVVVAAPEVVEEVVVAAPEVVEEAAASPALVAADSAEYVAEAAAWETDSKINTTDNWNNEKEKGDMDEFSWDQFDMSEFTFSDLLNLLKSDDQVVALAQGVKANYVARYEQEASELPEVCDAGKECRRKIKVEATEYLTLEWEETMKMIRSTVEHTVSESRELLKQAYKDAFYCEGGCTCEFVEARYSHLVASYKEIQDSIVWYENEIDVRLNYFTELDTHCVHFLELDERAALEETLQGEIADLDGWLDDGFELEDSVDQIAFEAKYGFKYESSEFDRYFAAADRTSDYNQATETDLSSL